MRPAPRRTLLAAVALAAACGGANPPPAAPTTCPIVAAPATPSFSQHILPALQQSCGSQAVSCHGTATPGGHVAYWTGAGRTAHDVRADLVNVVPASAPAGYFRVAPGDPAHSWIIAKITEDVPGGSAAYGTRMPQQGPDVCQATVDALSAWIAQGAEDN